MSKWDIILRDHSVPNWSDWQSSVAESNKTYNEAREFLMQKEIEARAQGEEFTAFMNSIRIGNKEFIMVSS